MITVWGWARRTAGTICLKFILWSVPLKHVYAALWIKRAKNNIAFSSHGTVTSCLNGLHYHFRCSVNSQCQNVCTQPIRTRLPETCFLTNWFSSDMPLSVVAFCPYAKVGATSRNTWRTANQGRFSVFMWTVNRGRFSLLKAPTW